MASKFSDLSDMMTTDQISQLSSVYSDVEDIDLYIGGLMERPVPGGRLGPTFSCIISNQVKRAQKNFYKCKIFQMKRLKNGDRYFFSLVSSASRFSPEQLEEVRKVSLARILCDNSEVKYMQPKAMKRVSRSNPLLDCNSRILEHLNLR